MSFADILPFRLTNINKYFRKLLKGADNNNIPEFIQQLRDNVNCAFDDNEILDKRQIDFYIKRSSNPKNYFSINRLAYMYSEGIGVEKNEKIFVELTKILLQNDICGYAATKMGYIYSQYDDYKDPIKAYQFTKDGFEKGSITAIVNMAIFYESGTNSVEKNISKAIELYELSITKGSNCGKRLLAKLYARVMGNFTKAQELYEDVINNDYGYNKANSLFNLGYMYQMEMPTLDTNNETAIKYYKMCIDFCSKFNRINFNELLWKAANNSALIYHNKKDYITARKLYELSFNFDNKFCASAYNLAEMYLEGHGGEKDIIYAIKFYYKGTYMHKIIKLIDENMNDDTFLDKLTDVLTYDDFWNVYKEEGVPIEIADLSERKRLSNISIDI